MTRERSRFDAVVPREAVPSRARDLAERRVGGMLEAFNWQQTYSATIHGYRHAVPPTLLDILVSAYLQGIDDAVETYARNGLEFTPRETQA